MPRLKAARFVIAMLASILLFCGSAQAQKGEPLSKPYAILVYADWCYNCKQIIPRLDKLIPKYADRIEFERFDMTNDERKVHSRQRAKDLGVGATTSRTRAPGCCC